MCSIFFLRTPIALTDQGDSNQSSHDAYVTAEIGDARVLIPFLADDVVSSGVCSLVFNGLTKTDKDLQIIGDLARRWDVSDDGTKITFYLRKNVTWHDGKPLTAHDIKFTFDVLLDPATGCPYTASFSDIEEIEVLDDYTIRFMYRQPYAPALSKLGIGIIPRHILEGEDLRTSAYKRAPVGSGPYTFTTWKTDQYIILSANPAYFEHEPYINKYVFRIIPDQAVQYLELIAGSVDAMSLTPYQYHYRSQTPRFVSQLEKYHYLSHSYTYVGYNLKNSLFEDVRVRQALSYAIDRQEIITGVLMGLGESCSGPFLKGTPYYALDAPDYAYDLEKARALLDEAGWVDRDGDGVRDKDGKPFVFKLITNQGNKAREDIAAIIQRAWQKVGVKVDVQVIAWASFLDHFIKNKKFEAVILGWTTPLDPDCFNVWHSEASKEGGLNFISYKNLKVDNLIMEGRRTYDPEARARIYKEIHRLIAQDAPYTFLYFPYATPAVAKRFKGVDPAPAGIGYNFIDWQVPEREVKYKW